MYVCMYVCMYIRSLRNAILCLCKFICKACAMLEQQRGQNVPRGTTMGYLQEDSHCKCQYGTWLLIPLTAVLVAILRTNALSPCTPRQRVGQTIKDLHHKCAALHWQEYSHYSVHGSSHNSPCGQHPPYTFKLFVQPLSATSHFLQTLPHYTMIH